jgi:hypothetical protein
MMQSTLVLFLLPFQVQVSVLRMSTVIVHRLFGSLPAWPDLAPHRREEIGRRNSRSLSLHTYFLMSGDHTS